MIVSNEDPAAGKVDGATRSIPHGVKRIVLTGFMGAGKTTVGRALAELLGWEFLDLDQHLESRTGSTIPDLFKTFGETHFRRLESAALANALARTNTVLALGGGTPEEMANRLLLEQTPCTVVVFLDAPFPVLFDRCMLEGIGSPELARPVLTSPAEAEARFAVRLPLYRRLARITLGTAALTSIGCAQALHLELTQLAIGSARSAGRAAGV